MPIDAVISAELGAHALSVVTAIHVQDSAGLESIYRISPELIDDQARCLLEDMPVGAIKVGPAYDPETISVLAQITADYSNIPLVVHMTAQPDISDLDELDPEETIGALLELLIPQAAVIVTEQGLLDQWRSAGMFGDDPIAVLHELGATHVLCSNIPFGASLNGLALYTRDGPGARWTWPQPAVRIHDSDGLLASAIAVALAGGLSAADAIQKATHQATTMLGRHFHPGMGQRLLRHTQVQP
ncbi:MAG: hydroxymethylpyrimidine/phosphomethylpyrimidine kinase [Alcaligenaceae bacterium]|nr:hydroxymethylpyrimidine/phosphomethylpyrimidine kinase [Alcaligenaceae bacterium]